MNEVGARLVGSREESRMNGRAAITSKILRLRNYADSLQAILDAMPEELTEIQDQALFHIVFPPGNLS